MGRDERAAGSLIASLDEALPGCVSTRATDRLAMAHDASHYLLVPEAVITPRSADDVAALLRAADRLAAPLTFRSGGSSLSGQAGTEHLLVDTRRHFQDITVLDGGTRVRVQPGATLRQVNNRLAPYARKLGPDPASESACTVGGVIANNSSGMACGTEFNTYRTIESAVLLLPGGVTIDTAAADADRALAQGAPDLHRRLLELRDRVRADPASVATIQEQFSLKNTMGYGLNALLDHDDPVAMLLHLVVGSEGTLAFVAEATFRTLPVHKHAATGLLTFDTLRRATDALPDLVASGLATCELLDATSLKVAQTDPQAADSLRAFTVAEHAALLVEYQADTAEALTERLAAAGPLLADLPLTVPADLGSDPRARAALWHIRKGLYATVAGARPSGTTALLEDIAVPVAALADTCEQLTKLFDRHDYEASVIFGHAKDGNIHFLLNERFDAEENLDRYLAFTDDMVELVLTHRGTLKAEHGTGRIMAPFVRRQYGDELYDVMVALKRACDPAGLLNPGAVLSDDPRAHVSHLKTTPTVEAEVDRCVECGYCEPVCPSRTLTLTPRQRIVLRRERARADAAGDDALVAEIDADYAYEGVDTCAADSMCQTACPVGIDTGQLVKRLRSERHHPVQDAAWTQAAKHWSGVTRAAAAGLNTARRMPAVSVRAAALGRRVLGADTVPQWSADLPRGGAARREHVDPNAEIVYFPSCTGAMFGPATDDGDTRSAFLALCDRAGVTVRTPAGVDGLCCATPWTSKGQVAGKQAMAARTLPALWRASDGGRRAVVCDATSCSEGLTSMVADATGPYAGLQVVDSLAFAVAELLPRLTVRHPVDSVTVHPTCSSTRLSLNDDLTRLAAAAAGRAEVPVGWGCCAFAGDRGLLHPDLTAAATATEAAQVAASPTTAYVSANRTCEIGMTRATGAAYVHVLELLERATRPCPADHVRPGRGRGLR